jgi:hypothetical protein
VIVEFITYSSITEKKKFLRATTKRFFTLSLFSKHRLQTGSETDDAHPTPYPKYRGTFHYGGKAATT